MIKACALTDKGIEKVALIELDEMIKAKGKAEERVAIFEAKSEDDLLRFCYKTQSSQRVLILFDQFVFSDYEDFLKKAEAIIGKLDLKGWLREDSSFRVSCERLGEHDFGSSTVEQDVGGFIVERAKKSLGFEPAVKLESPELIFYIFVNEERAYLGMDLVGRDLSKRHYRIFTSPGIINANLTYAMVCLSNYKKKERLVDFFCKSGIICIEAALKNSGISINNYNKDFAFKRIRKFERDWDDFFKKADAKNSQEPQDILGLDPILRNIEASKKNAKLAGVDKLIMFSKMDLDWLDTKLDEKSVDVVISRIPCPSKHLAEGAVKKTYKELFYQAEFFMKKKGRLCLLAENTDLLKGMIDDRFELVSEEDLWAGKQIYHFVTIMKK
ncbi:MAG: THUMP domain-containing protein [archaeon]